jgi:hypothetical protein
MHHLFVRTLDGAAADPVSQSQVLVVAHTSGILAVVANQRTQTVSLLRRGRVQTPQADDHGLHRARSQVLGNLVDPTLGWLAAFPEAQSGKFPGMLHRVPKVQNFTTRGE